MFVSRWTVDYGDGPHPVAVPHAWNQDVSVEWEGPAVYRTEIDVSRGGGTLRFHGVSYAAEVLANGVAVARHKGIWDAFDVPLPGGKVELEVRVVKNGGPTYPVGTVASGGLPYLFQTFGGIYREVELLEESKPLVLPPPAPRGELPYVRGVVHRGWYPDLGHPNPDEPLIRKELREIKALGFNLVKFAGWVPSHRYLDLLEAEGMLGWLELPMGQAGLALQSIAEIGAEIERIVLRYRHHSCLAAWTVCDIFGSTLTIRPFVRDLTEMVRALTGGAWVTDVAHDGFLDFEFEPTGSFDDLHLIDESPRSLDALQPGPYPARPVLLGEYGGDTLHRDLARLGDELPFWASALPELNTNPKLARLLDASPFALEPTLNGHKPLIASSRSRRAYRLKQAVENARARAGWIHGYAVEELRDTPVSSCGLFDDWGEARLLPEECARWNGPLCLYVLPRRKFTTNGFQPLDPFNHYPGPVRMSIGVHTDSSQVGVLWWRIVDEHGLTCARGGGERLQVEGAHVVGEVHWSDAPPGDYRLEAGFGPATNAWDLWVVEPETTGERTSGPTGNEAAVSFHEPAQAPAGVLFLRRGDAGVLDRPGYHDFQFLNEAFWKDLSLRERWSRLEALDRGDSLSQDWLKERFGSYEPLLNGIDSLHTATDQPILVRADGWFVTTLDPGNADSLTPAGSALLRHLRFQLYGTSVATSP